MAELVTTLGRLKASELGLVLPHEHVFVDFRVPSDPEHAVADVADVVGLMAPEVARAAEAGVTAMVDCTPVGVGRRADVVVAVSRATGVPIALPTGIYREPWVPHLAMAASEAELADWMVRELEDEVGGAGVPAAWVKLSVGDDGITDREAVILRAAAQAGRRTGALIGSHTKRGRVVHDELDIVEAAGYTAERFVWIHAQSDPDPDVQRSVARRGAWLEYDGIGGDADDLHETLILRALDEGIVDQVLLSQDRGWYDPAKPGGGTPKPYTHLVTDFLPRLVTAGVDAATLRTLTVTNPFRAFAR